MGVTLGRTNRIVWGIIILYVKKLCVKKEITDKSDIHHQNSDHSG